MKAQPGRWSVCLWAVWALVVERVCPSEETQWRLPSRHSPSSSPSWPMTSEVELGVKDTVPWPERWCRCRYCAVRAGRGGGSSKPFFEVQFHDPLKILSFPSHVGPVYSSKWHGFFHTATEQVNATISPSPFSASQCDSTVSRPVFVLPILTWHVGHLVVDILEPLYYTLQPLGIDRAPVAPDILIYMDVANEDERIVLPSLLATTVNDPSPTLDSPFRLLRLFTRHAVLTKGDLIGQSRITCFTSDLQLGLDVSSTYYTQATDRHLLGLSPSQPLDTHMMQRYQGFRDFLWRGLGLPLAPTADPPTVNVIRRVTSRRLTNHAALIIALRQYYPQVDEMVLESMSFSDQLRAFQSTSIFVSQYGTAAHNVVFLKPGSILVLLMQPGWCDWHWTYSDQARLLGIHVLVYCHPPEAELVARHHMEGEERYRYYKRYWRQGPWYSKDMDYDIDMATLLRGLDSLHNMSQNASTSAPLFLVVHGPSPTDPITLPPSPTSTTDLSPIRAHLTLDTIAPLDDTDMNYKVQLVPEVIMLMGVLQGLGAHVEGRYCICLQVFVMDDGSVSAPNGIPESSETICYKEDDFNEFSTVDVVVPEGEYVVHAWLEEANHQDAEQEMVVVPTSDCFLAFHTAHGQSLDLTSLPESEVLHLGLSVGEEARSASVRLGWPTALAWDTAQSCRDLHLDSPTCALLVRMIFREAWGRLEQGLPSQLPAPQSLPTPSWPFIFYHLEKSGGSTLRPHIVQASLQAQHRLSFFLPCYDDEGVFDETFRSCHKWSVKDHMGPEERAKLAVVAGHFQWNVRDELPSASTAPSCFTILRNPVDRAVSFYYERVHPFYGKPVNDLTPGELESIMQDFYGSAWGKYRDEGMSNAACKLFCDAHTHHGLDPFVPPPPPIPLNLTLAQERLGTCVVGIQEDWENTKKVLWHWFPWLKFADTYRQNVGNVTAERSANLRAELRDILLHYNQCDSALYHYARRLFRRQLEALPGHWGTGTAASLMDSQITAGIKVA